MASKSTPPDAQLVVLTFNVWFDDTFYFAERTSAIFGIIKSTDADIVCLQEVIPSLVVQLKKQLWMSAFHLSAVDKLEPYGVIMLVRKSLGQVAFSVKDLPSRMGRKLVVAEFVCTTGHLFRVGTVHLESLESRATREHQLKVVVRSLHEGASAETHFVLAGDFNFDSRRPFADTYKCASDGVPRKDSDEEKLLENNVLCQVLPGFTDTWAALALEGEGISGGGEKTQKLGFTFDSERNSNIRNAELLDTGKKEKYEQMRYDRVMFSFPEKTPSGSDGAWVATSCAILGTCALPRNSNAVAKLEEVAAAEDTVDLMAQGLVFPSDHFGVCVAFRCFNSAAAAAAARSYTPARAAATVAAVDAVEGMVAAAAHPKYARFFKMAARLPRQAVAKQMKLAGLDPVILDTPRLLLPRRCVQGAPAGGDSGATSLNQQLLKGRRRGKKKKQQRHVVGGKRVVLQTIVTLRRDGRNQRYHEFVLEDGTTVREPLEERKQQQKKKIAYDAATMRPQKQ